MVRCLPSPRFVFVLSLVKGEPDSGYWRTSGLYPFVGVWVRFLPVSLVTEDLLGGMQAVGVGGHLAADLQGGCF